MEERSSQMQIGIKYEDCDIRELIAINASKATGINPDNLCVYLGQWNGIFYASVSHIDMKTHLKLLSSRKEQPDGR